MTRAKPHDPRVIPTQGNEDDRQVPLRTCIVTGETLPQDGLIRFVLAPDGTVTPDIFKKLPGRGLWVKADAATLRLAVLRNRFAVAARRSVKIPPDLPGQVESQCLSRLEGAPGMANRANLLAAGIDGVMNVLLSGKLVCM